MERVRTVTGDIKKEALGWCQCHEHIFLAKGPSGQIDEALCMDDYEKAKSECFLFKKAGGGSFIDCQPGRFGRIAKELARVSEETKVNIIAVTGFHKLEFCEDIEYFKNASGDRIAQGFIDEVNLGMFEGGKRLYSKAGVIKCALSKRGSNKSTYEKLFLAVADSAKETNVPILVHFDQNTEAQWAINFFEKRGIKPDKLMLCHLDRTRFDFSYHREIASSGAYLEYDTINRLKYHSNDKEIELIAHMVEKGFVDNLLLGMDTTNKRLKAYGAEFGLDYILTYFKQQMVAYGISKEAIDNIMIENASKALAF